MISVQEEIPDGTKYRPRSVPSEWFFCNQARKIPETSRVERNQILVRDYFVIAAAGQFVPRRRASARGHRGLGRCELCGQDGGRTGRRARIGRARPDRQYAFGAGFLLHTVCFVLTHGRGVSVAGAGCKPFGWHRSLRNGTRLFWRGCRDRTIFGWNTEFLRRRGASRRHLLELTRETGIRISRKHQNRSRIPCRSCC
mgnify:FL=1